MLTITHSPVSPTDHAQLYSTWPIWAGRVSHVFEYRECIIGGLSTPCALVEVDLNPGWAIDAIPLFALEYRTEDIDQKLVDEREKVRARIAADEQTVADLTRRIGW